MARDSFLSLQKVSVTLGGKTILKGIDLEIAPGEIAYLVGANGAGKSTLLRLLIGELSPSTGKAILPANVFVLTQNPLQCLYPSLTISEHLRLLGKRGVDLKEYLARFHRKLPSLLDQRISSLSGGERQALALALMLIKPPKLLLLDEFTSALDPKAALELMDLTLCMVEEFEVATLMITHNTRHLREHPRRVIGIRQGGICLDQQEVSSEVLASLYEE